MTNEDLVQCNGTFNFSLTVLLHYISAVLGADVSAPSAMHIDLKTVEQTHV